MTRHDIFKRIKEEQRRRDIAKRKAEAEIARAERTASNSSKYRYVRYHRGKKKPWMAENPKTGTYLGSYSTETEAAQAVADLLGINLEALMLMPQFTSLWRCRPAQRMGPEGRR